jgi:hypothetical protein
MNSSNGNTKNWICSRALRTRQTVALVISTCALALGAFTASAAPDRVTLRYVSATNTVETINSGRIPIRTGMSFIGPIDNRTGAIGLVRPLGRHPASANHFSATTAAPVRRAASLREKWWCYF